MKVGSAGRNWAGPWAGSGAYVVYVSPESHERELRRELGAPPIRELIHEAYDFGPRLGDYVRVFSQRGYRGSHWTTRFLDRRI